LFDKCHSIVSHDDVPLIEEDPQTVIVQSGQTVYFGYTLILGFIFEVPTIRKARLAL
jgi:hypothetical protein